MNSKIRLSHQRCTTRKARPTGVSTCTCVALNELRPPLRPCRSTHELGARRRTPPQEWGTTGAAWKEPSWYKLINNGLEQT